MSFRHDHSLTNDLWCKAYYIFLHTAKVSNISQSECNKIIKVQIRSSEEWMLWWTCPVWILPSFYSLVHEKNKLNSYTVVVLTRLSGRFFFFQRKRTTSAQIGATKGRIAAGGKGALSPTWETTKKKSFQAFHITGITQIVYIAKHTRTPPLISPRTKRNFDKD